MTFIDVLDVPLVLNPLSLVPTWSLPNAIVVADKDLFTSINVSTGHNRHDFAKPVDNIELELFFRLYIHITYTGKRLFLNPKMSARI
jgi:hypothetical protein